MDELLLSCQLSKYSVMVDSFCKGRGAASVEEVAKHPRLVTELLAHLGLKELERERFRQALVMVRVKCISDCSFTDRGPSSRLHFM